MTAARHPGPAHIGSATSADQEESSMAQHRFRIGQRVSYTPGKLSMSSSSSEFKVIRQLPSEAGECMYRIKSEREPFERVARESEISLRA